MKIINENDDKFWSQLVSFVPGTPVVFKHPFHQDNKDSDIFIVNTVCSSYRPDRNGKYDNKIAMTNLRSGHLSYVDPMRDVRAVPCEIVIRREKPC